VRAEDSLGDCAKRYIEVKEWSVKSDHDGCEGSAWHTYVYLRFGRRGSHGSGGAFGGRVFGEGMEGQNAGDWWRNLVTKLCWLPLVGLSQILLIDRVQPAKLSDIKGGKIGVLKIQGLPTPA
jgi:hypothetical protein